MPYKPVINQLVQSKENETQKRTTPRSLDVTRLTFRFPPSSSSTTFQTLTSLSVPPVTMHPLIYGLTSIEETAPSCAERVKRAGDGRSRFEGRVRASKLRTRPFSSETCSYENGNQGEVRSHREESTYIKPVPFPRIPP